ncbi:multiple inositol polyphosphate phosphatase 1-like [Trichoplusia ni]|uniref:Multiple inositol polyphosphate phosphatase 1 n=1 Tax=Trichoplusia ni TaxID=7111 RepID=A0A7E5WH83_TRINI|nr:multiple inositol polyphosphate phosphatase 1-like [Trichoplusia ni]
MKLFLPIIIALCSLGSVSSLFCYWNTGCPYKYHSNKTPYNAVRGDIRDSAIKLKGCEAVSIWGLLRHGKRNPGILFVKQMKDAVAIRDYVASSYEKGNSSLCAQDVENLRNWMDDKKTLDKPFQLTDEGYQEALGIGQRFKQAFPKLLSNLEPNDYVFRHAHGMWILDSAKGFVEGLSKKQLKIEPHRTDFDILSPYDACPRYLDEVKNNPETYAESVKFMSSSDYLAAKDRIQRRLGIDYPLTDTNITALYDLCRYFSSGIDTKFSPWCALFTTGDLKAMEYISDLRHYYRSGYGTPMNELFGQITLSDLLRSFQNVKSGGGKKISTYITHTTMIDMVYTALKLFKDDAPLTAARMKPDRKWRSSKLAVFSTNLMVVLNRCNNDDYNVVFYSNEEPIRSICKEGVCSWEEFEGKLSPFLETTIDFCEPNGPTK